MRPGLPLAAPGPLLNLDLGAKRLFIHYFTTSFPRLRVRVTHSKELTRKSRRCSQVDGKMCVKASPRRSVRQEGRKRGEWRSWAGTYNQNGRPDHFWNTLPELGRRARFPQSPRKPPRLLVRWSSHCGAPLRINEPLNPRLSTKFRGESSPFHPRLRSPVRTSRLSCVAPPMSDRSHLSFSYFSHIH